MSKLDVAVPTYSPDKIFVKGSILQKTLLERVHQIEGLRTVILEEITAQLREACGPDDDPVEKAAGLLIILEEGYGLSAVARKIKAFLGRAAELNREHRELSRFGRTIMQDAVYELSWNEADRFGL